MKSLTEKEIEALKKIANVTEDVVVDEVEEFDLCGAATLIHNKTANTIKVKIKDAYLDYVTSKFEKIASLNMEGRSSSDIDSYRVAETSNNADEWEFNFIDAGFGKSAEKGQLEIRRNGSVYGTYKADYNDYYGLTKRFIFCNLDTLGWKQDRLTGEWMKEPFKLRKRAEGGGVVQNIFFDDAKDLHDYMEKQKTTTPTEEKKEDATPANSEAEVPQEGDVSMSDVEPSTEGAPSENTPPVTATPTNDKTLPEIREEKAVKSSSKKTAETKEEKDVVTIYKKDSNFMSEYNRLKSEGYSTDFSGEGKIQMSKKKNTEKKADSSKDEEIKKRDIELEQAAVDEYTGEFKVKRRLPVEEIFRLGV